MSNLFSGSGNLGGHPVLKEITGRNQEDYTVTEFTVFIDNQRKVDGEYVDHGGFWLKVTLWDRLAEWAKAHLQKGARVRVVGSLRMEFWNDKDTGEEKSGLVLDASEVYPDPLRVEGIQWRQSQRRETTAPAAA